VIELALPRLGAKRPLQILCLGAHCDDIDIGCGATLLKLLSRPGSAQVTWVVFGSTPTRARELRASAKRFLRGATSSSVVTHGFRDSYFPAQYKEIKESFEPLKALPTPDVVFTHRGDDLHQDHRLVSELTWNAFRRHLILEYEVPKYDGDLTTPNAYCSVADALVERKIKILMSSYRTQIEKPWFTAETFKAIMRLRGVEAGADTGWAEGFHARKFSIG
jgi:LmbE family N-acetylglucosaminyl deacetylase